MLNKSTVVALLASGLISVAGGAFAADTADGKATFEQVCSTCHEIGDWKGKSEADLKTMISDIVSGKTKHKKALKLTDAQVDNVAAFIAAGGK